MRELILAYLTEEKLRQKQLLEIQDKTDSYGRGYRDGALETLDDVVKWVQAQEEEEVEV